MYAGILILRKKCNHAFRADIVCVLLILVHALNGCCYVILMTE